MQYKIPVQIENEDPIFLGLSLKQLIIFIVGSGIGYLIFKGLVNSGIPGEIASIPFIFFVIISLIVVLFKHSGMTFVPFMLNLIRLNLNSDPKIWEKGVDSYSPLEIGYVEQTITKKENKIDISNKKEKLKALQDKLNKI